MTEYCRTVEIVNVRGLHARASAKFVTEATTLPVRVMVKKDDMEAVGTSIMGLMMLGAAIGDSISICAEGEGAQRAVDSLAKLVEDKFGEE
jgi:phosphocarrier protein HPr